MYIFCCYILYYFVLCSFDMLMPYVLDALACPMAMTDAPVDGHLVERCYSQSVTKTISLWFYLLPDG